MRIVFICSSLEPGRDGVGDYTRSLAQECRRLGHACAIVALHDRHRQSVLEEAGADIPELRLPGAMPWAQRVAHVVAFFEAFNPDWISLQFVAYGFNNKGLIWNLSGHLELIIGGLPLHIMFHELWIGCDEGAPAEDRLVGAAQRHLVLGMLGRLAPRAVATSNQTYLAMLSRAGVAAARLPLFGNIPITENPKFEWIYSAGEGAAPGLSPATREEFWIFGIFGSLHPAWPAEPLLGRLRDAGRSYGKRIILVTIGRIGAAGQKCWDQVVRDYGRDCGLLQFGEQPEDRVSELFQWLDFGLSTSPWALIEKSSSLVAMLDHGVPVIANRDNWHLRVNTPSPDSADPLLYKLDDELESKLAGGFQKRTPRRTLPEIAIQFIDSLHQTEV